MLLIKRGSPSEDWGISQCQRCSKIPPTGMLCQSCLEKRSAHDQAYYNANKRSWEYRIRAWLVKLLKPEAYIPADNSSLLYQLQQLIDRHLFNAPN